MITHYAASPTTVSAHGSSTVRRHSQRRLLALAVLGYCLLTLLALGLTALGVEALARVTSFGLLVAPLVLICVFRFAPPSSRSSTGSPGIRVDRRDSEELFRLLDRICSQLRVPRLETIWVSADCNAAVVRARRLRLLHGRDHQLVIGLTLMKALTVDQLAAVIAHEIAHVARKHTLVNGLVSRLRMTIEWLCAPLSRAPLWIYGLPHAAARRYLQALYKAHISHSYRGELQSDQDSARITSARVVAQALTASSVLRAYLVQKYWPAVVAAAKDSPLPVGSPYSGLSLAPLIALSEDVRQWQQAALFLTSSEGDTHPSLRERLAAIGAAAEFAPPSPGESADQLLGSNLGRVASSLDGDWRIRIQKTWETLYQIGQQQRRQLLNLRAAALVSPLAEAQALLHASLEECIGAGPLAALSMRSALLERFPQSLGVQFALGRQRLLAGEAVGATLVEGVISKDLNALAPGAELLRRYHSGRGELSLAEVWRQRYALGLAAQGERQAFALLDEALPHGLMEQVLTGLVRQLRTVSHLKGVYLVRKKILHFTQHPVYVLGFRSTGLFGRYDRARAASVAQTIRQRISFPARLLIVDMESDHSRLAWALHCTFGARIM
jgi:Zn-dependent protease with chaperone function